MLFEDLCLRLTGKLGSKVWYYRDGSHISRAYVKPVQPATTKQVTWWDIFADGVAEWQSLNQSQKNIWNIKTQHIHESMTGFNLFMRNYLRSHYSPAPSTNPLMVRKVSAGVIYNLRGVNGYNGSWLYIRYSPILALAINYDNSNYFWSYNTLSSAAALTIRLMCSSNPTISYQYADGVDIEYWDSLGIPKNLRIKIPAVSLPYPTRIDLWVADDGSTYYDSAMTLLACPGNA